MGSLFRAATRHNTICSDFHVLPLSGGGGGGGKNGLNANPSFVIRIDNFRRSSKYLDVELNASIIPA